MTATIHSIEPKDRLTRAVKGLAIATHEQHISIVKFMDKMDDLAFQITQLEHSCLTFHAKCKQLDFRKLRRRSQRLARLMSTV